IGLSIPDDLLDRLRSDVRTPDALPLLAYVLRELYEAHGASKSLTLEQYKAIGCLEGAIRERADEAIQVSMLSHEEKEALHAALVPKLVSATADGGFAAHPAPLQQSEKASRLLRRLVQARLLKTYRDERGQETIEIIHEALIRVWPLLAKW